MTRVPADEQRLRETLREIADLPEPLGARNSPAAIQCDYLKNIARAALEATDV